MAGNADKTAIAAVKQVVTIERLREKNVLEDLSDELRELALARLEHREMSMQELADALKISKSCINHRFRRLTELAKRIEEQEKK